MASDVEAPDAQDMLLLATYLFTTLPQLAPRTTVDLASRLGDGQVGWVLGEMWAGRWVGGCMGGG